MRAGEGTSLVEKSVMGNDIKEGFGNLQTDTFQGSEVHV